MWVTERLKPKNWNGTRVRNKQHKMNGHRLTIWKQKDGRLVGWERTIRDDREITLLRPDIVKYDWWKALEQIPPMSCVDGEAYTEFGNAGSAAHAIAECLPTLEFMPFAVPWWKSENKFDAALERVDIGLHTYTGLKLAPFFKLMEHDTEELLIKDAIDLGIEGWVLKEANYLSWWKVKPTYPIDAIITGLKWAEQGKYLGAVGSLLCSIYIKGELVEIACVSGMDDKTRWDLDKKDIGRVIEVEYQELGNGNRLIHPRFSQWRDDKPAEECAYNWSEI